MLNWQAVQALVDRRAVLLTLRGRPFRVLGLTETGVIVGPRTGWQYTFGRADLERAVALLEQGETIAGPGDYRRKVSTTQPSYAWGILHALGYV